jgi:hypothetical protein
VLAGQVARAPTFRRSLKPARLRRSRSRSSVIEFDRMVSAQNALPFHSYSGRELTLIEKTKNFVEMSE